MSAIVVRRITAQETAPVRQEVLRPMQTLAECVYEHDGASDAMHFGAYDGAELIGVSTVTREACPNVPEVPGCRLRGMAVREAYRSRGVGGQLMAAMVETLESQGFIGLLWCNARTPARKFYEREGWYTVGDEFGIAPLGPHFRMLREMSVPVTAEELAAQLTPTEERRVEMFRLLRAEAARARQIPAYLIAANKDLATLARSMPRTPDELRTVPGYKEARTAAYGEEICEWVRKAYEVEGQ